MIFIYYRFLLFHCLFSGFHGPTLFNIQGDLLILNLSSSRKIYFTYFIFYLSCFFFTHKSVRGKKYHSFYNNLGKSVQGKQIVILTII